MKNKITMIYKLIVYLTFLLFIGIINFNNCFKIEKSTKVIIIFFSFFILMFVLNKFIISKLNKKILDILTVLNITILIILEIIAVYFFRVEYNWDFRFIMEGAIQLAQSATTEHIHYFQVFPNNIGTLFIVTLGMKIFNNNEIGAYVLNICLVAIADIITIITAKKIGGEKMSFNVSILMILCMPYWLYTPIVYSDTLSVLVPVLTILLWIKCKDATNKSKKWLYIGLITIFAFIGYIIKPIAVIGYVAIIIEMFFSNIKYIKKFIASFLVFCILINIYNFFVYKFFLKTDAKNTEIYPYTHWVMMGMNKPFEYGGTSNGWGGYSYYDVMYTESNNSYEEKIEANIKKIKERLLEFGTKGYLSFLSHKIIYIWNDGTYYINAVLKWSPLNQNTKIYSWFFGENSNKFVEPYFNAFHILLMLMIAIGTISEMIKERRSNIRILEMCIIGVFIFLLFWEARSRYIYILIPIFSILAGKGCVYICDISIMNIIYKIKNRMKGKRKNEENISSHTNVL